LERASEVQVSTTCKNLPKNQKFGPVEEIVRQNVKPAENAMTWKKMAEIYEESAVGLADTV